MMAERMVIGLARLGGSAVAFASDGSRHSIHRRSGQTWQEWRSWTGGEITAFCTCQRSVVVCEPEGHIRLFGPDEALLSVSEGPWFHGATALDGDEVLLGGVRGAIGILGIQARTVRSTSLVQLGVSKPGRNILNVTKLDENPVFLGSNRLFARFGGARCEEILEPGRSSERRFDVHYAVRAGGQVWVSGLSGVSPSLTRVHDHGLVPVEHPELGDAAPPIFSVGDTLYLLTDSIWALTSSGWRQQAMAGSPLVGMTIHEEALLAVGEDGSCFAQQGGAWLQSGRV